MTTCEKILKTLPRQKINGVCRVCDGVPQEIKLGVVIGLDHNLKRVVARVILAEEFELKQLSPSEGIYEYLLCDTHLLECQGKHPPRWVEVFRRVALGFPAEVIEQCANPATKFFHYPSHKGKTYAAYCLAHWDKMMKNVKPSNKALFESLTEDEYEAALVLES